MMSNFNPLQPNINAAPVSPAQLQPLPPQEEPTNRASAQAIDPMDIDLMDRSVKERDVQAQFYYDQILALIPDADLCDLNAFSEKMGNGFWDGYQVKADQKQPADLIFSLIQSFESSERAKFLTILDEFCDSIVNTFDQRIDLQRHTYTLLCNIELIPSKNRLAKLTVAFNTICILGEVNDYEGAFYSGNRFLNVMPRLSKSQVEVMGQVVTHLFQKLGKVGENSGKLVNDIYDGLLRLRLNKEELIQIIDCAIPLMQKGVFILKELMRVSSSKKEKVVAALELLSGHPGLSKVVTDLNTIIVELNRTDEEKIVPVTRDMLQFLPFVSEIQKRTFSLLITTLSQFSGKMRELMIKVFKANCSQLRLRDFDLTRVLRVWNETPPSQWGSSFVLINDLRQLLKGRPLDDLCALLIILKGIDHQTIRAFFEMISMKLEGTGVQYAGFTYLGFIPGTLSEKRQVVLRDLLNYPLEKVATLLDKVKPNLVNNVSFFSDLVDILSVLLAIEPENLDEAIDLVFSSIRDLKNPNCSALMKGMNVKQLREFFPLLDQFLVNIRLDDEEIPRLIQAIENCTPEERLDLLSVVAPYMNGMTKRGVVGRALTLTGLLSIPDSERAETFRLVFPYIRALTHGHSWIFVALAKVPMERRRDLIVLGERLLGGIKDAEVFHKVCEDLLKQISLEDIARISDELYRLISAIPHHSTRLSVVITLLKQPLDQREVVLERVLSLCSRMPYGHEAVVDALISISENDQRDVNHHLNGPSNDGYELALKIRAMQTYKEVIDSEEGQMFLSAYHGCLDRIEWKGMEAVFFDSTGEKPIPTGVLHLYKKRLAVMQCIDALPFEMAQRAVRELSDIHMNDPIYFERLVQSDIALFVARFFRDEIEQLINYWRDQMQHNPNKEKVRQLADFIARRGAGSLGLNEEHEIVQLAIRTFILLLSANSDPLNPYHIFQRLEAKRAEPMNWDNMNPSIEILNGYSLSFNPTFFGSEMKEIVIRAGQLPKVSPDFLDRHLSVLKARFASEEGLTDQVKELTGLSFAEIEEHAVFDQFLARHLSFEGDQDAIVPIVTARFFAIAAYIDSLSETRNQGDDFSDREMTFIKMLGSIMFCPTGKSDGIGRYYLNVLPASCRYGQGAAPAPESRLVDLPHDQSKLVICEILAEEIEKMFSGNNVMMKQIAGVRGEIQQASHQGFYLRNLLGKDLLGSTKVYFDAHTQVLYENLVALDKQEAMQIFFTYFKPSTFVQLLAKKFDLDIGETVEEFVRIGLFKAAQN
jgi:hypothetical protein